MGTRIPEPVCYINETLETYSALGYPPYRWVHSEDAPPWAPLTKPLAESTIGVIASGGIYETGQVAFHFNDDASFRVIDKTVDRADLRTTHFAYDMTDARKNINCVFPIDTLAELEAAGEVGGIANELYTFMGGIYSARKVREQLAPALVERTLAAGDVDLMLLVPA